MDHESLIQESIKALEVQFQYYEKISQLNTEKVLKAFKKNNIALRHFNPSNGYGYDDTARDTLERLFSDIMGTEAAILRPQIASGTHALSLCLFGILKHGDNYISASGLPYDTLQTVMGINKEVEGSIKDLGVEYRQVDLIDNASLDIDKVCASIDEKTKLIMVQRSRGYASRRALLPSEIGKLAEAVKKIKPDVVFMVDNCYGEFVLEEEPSNYKCVDIVAGSLIKNPGGGIAPTGGYICGKEKYINRIATRLTSPGLGLELGSYEASYRPFYQGLFFAPHVVCQALKVATLMAEVFTRLGFRAIPGSKDMRSDIVQILELQDEAALVAFCRAVQASSPIDAFVVPEPWDMPGYDNQVIMAAGSFVAGSSIELSADAPIREPFHVYVQGGLTFEHGVYAIKNILKNLNI